MQELQCSWQRVKCNPRYFVSSSELERENPFLLLVNWNASGSLRCTLGHGRWQTWSQGRKLCVWQVTNKDWDALFNEEAGKTINQWIIQREAWKPVFLFFFFYRLKVRCGGRPQVTKKSRVARSEVYCGGDDWKRKLRYTASTQSIKGCHVRVMADWGTWQTARAFVFVDSFCE